MTSTDAGIIILINPDAANVCFSIRDNLDPDSNVSEVSGYTLKKASLTNDFN
jgi:hypothetical protein